MDNTPEQQKSPSDERESPHERPKSPSGPRWAPFAAPSPRVTAALAAAMLAVGVAVGAAIGPAPSASFAGASGLPLPVLLRTLGVGAAQPGATTSTAAVQPPPVAAAATPVPARRRRRRHHKAAAPEAASSAGTPTAGSETSAPTEGSAPPPTTSKGKAAPLPPVKKVWLIELAGSSFAEAAAQPTAAPYIGSQAVALGTLLSGWSALDASAFANGAALIAGSPPPADLGGSVLDTIVQPPCPASSPQGEGAGAAQCAPDTPAGLTAADEFLEQTIPAIVASGPYRENGLIVVTFATVASASATGLPSGASTATLTSQPPAGALLISPFVAAGARSSITFTPQSPERSLDKLLRDQQSK
jgi:hypothetical protein